MKPIIVLVVIFILSLVGCWIFTGHWNIFFAGNLAMSVMLLFTAIGHFKFPKGMSMMMPPVIPYKIEMVYFTGLVEIAAAIGLMIPGLRHVTAGLLILFFILILPVNINAALRHIDLEKSNYEGNGPSYLWFRVPLQILFIAWTWYFSW